MELQFTFREGCTVTIPLPDQFFTHALKASAAVSLLPDLYDSCALLPPSYIEYQVDGYDLQRNGIFLPDEPKVLLCFWDCMIDLSLLWDECRLESSNWYGYDGEEGSEGPGDEDDEDSDEDSDLVSEE